MKFYQKEEFLRLLQQEKEKDYQQEEKLVRDILQMVKVSGDKALRELSKKYDKVELTDFLVGEDEVQAAYQRVDADFQLALKKASDFIRHFHSQQKPNSWMTTRVEGAVMGIIRRPLQKVGVYVPGGRAAYPSTVLMTVIPARLAGVEEIYICTPPDSSGEVNPFTLVAAQEAGADAVYKLGGAQAIAALAFGTESILAVDKIVGPGNIYVNLAKRMVFGQVGIDLPAGPSEVFLVADKKADARLVAWDLLAQAEHDPLARSVCLTDSYQLAQEIDAKINLFLAQQERKNIIEESLAKNGGIVLLSSLEEAWPLINTVAPEHVGLHIEDPWPHLAKITNAGAIFLGEYTPQTAGDYGAGPNHVLPTNRAARFASPLGIEDFFKSSSFLYYSPRAIFQEGEYFEIIAGVEGLYAHARALQIRREKANEKRSSDCARDCGNQS